MIRTSPFDNMPLNIFSRMSALAIEHDAINLGQGFPDEDGPAAIREMAAQTLREGPNQYAPMRGIPGLLSELSAHARREYGLEYDPETEILVTSGASEAIGDAIMGLAGPGGEVVLIEPSYDCYRPIAEAAGAVVRSLHLAPPEWRLTEDALRTAIGGETRAVVLNSPLNPIGRVFDAEELESVARVVRESDAVVICDEVYEHLVFDDRRHIPLATLPGMYERTVRIGSAGKMFSLTGWKIGWLMGPRALVDPVASAHQYLTFTTWGGGQAGIRYALRNEMAFTRGLTRELQQKRDLVAAGLEDIGFAPLPCEGSYFLTADIGALTDENDRDFCERLVREAQVALIPLSVFFPGRKPDNFVRVAFCKKTRLLEEALARLGDFFGK